MSGTGAVDVGTDFTKGRFVKYYVKRNSNKTRIRFKQRTEHISGISKQYKYRQNVKRATRGLRKKQTLTGQESKPYYAQAQGKPGLLKRLRENRVVFGRSGPSAPYAPVISGSTH